MRLLVTLVTGALGTYLSMPSQSEYGVGAWIRIGTPLKAYFLTPDFGASKTRFFMDGDLSLMPHLEPKAESSTWTESEDGTYFYDVMKIAKVGCGLVPFELSGRQVSTMDLKHVGGAHGRLGIGPESIIAQTKVIEFRKAALNYGPPIGHLTGSAMAVFDALPDVSEDAIRSEYPIARRADGWFLTGTLNLNGLKGSNSPVDIAIDINTYPILIPKKDMDRLVVILRMQKPHGKDVYVDDTGSLVIPCDMNGSFLVNMHVFVSLASGEPLNLDLPDSGRIRGVHPDSNQPVCVSPFEVNMYDGKVVISPSAAITIVGGEWRLNPSFIKGLRSVYMDGRQSRVIIDTVQSTLLDSISRGPVLQGFEIGRPRLDVTSEGAAIVFPRALPHEKGYSIESRFPAKGQDGSWVMTFVCGQTAVLATGKFGVEVFRNLQFEIPDERDFILTQYSDDILRLPLIRVPDNSPMTKSSKPRYALTINTGQHMMFIGLRPVTHSSHETVYAERMGRMVRNLADDFKQIGTK